MKKIITTTILVAASLFMSSVAISATNSANIKKSAQETVRREIERNIACPDFIQENSVINQVKAIVKVDTAGHVKVEEINSANPQLKAYVIDQLQNMKLKSTSENQKFVLVINFQVG
jgi:hypothetical protein